MLLLLSGLTVQAQIAPPNVRTRVLVMKIGAEIDPRTNRYTQLALDEATDWNADLVILELDTYGGLVTDADEIRTRLLEYEIPILVYINKDAASAGALIAIACDSIYMAPGASIGAATVVNQTGEAAPDKYQSYMRSIMRSTAEATGRDPFIAEAMVDENLEVPDVSPKGQVVTFSTSEAIKWGFCEARVSSIDEILQRNGITDYEVKEYQLPGTEKVVAFFINPFVSGLLILIIIGGLYFELQTPGVGFPLLAAVVALILYLVPHYLNGLAAHWEIILFFLGLGLIAVEVFILPGFGIAGVAGLVFTISALILIMVGNNWFDFEFVPSAQILNALLTAVIGMLGGVVLIVFGGMRFANSRAFSRVALESVQDRNLGYTSSFREQALAGRTGIAYTILRPSGKVLIDDVIYDASSRGDFIMQGEKIIVVEDTGSNLKVRKDA
ncbi:NfeD family protein [Cesiribacter andamanensis]|uniref:Signal peptide peptidase SppA, 36K type n=1 Tax=Cesiribacter andamanensis AMV16 TaxID=1279009 RepID=M7NLP5_9BACT|nr:NfeD family protein [Cesiribacter andamanensis]EMR02700.1 signal peptide peptidase SppA, 36K type [Cesiribacter andamanensis AMV16]